MNAQAAAHALLDAHRRRGVCPPFAADVAPQTIEDAYAIQDLVAADRGAIGGWKVGPWGTGGFTCAPVPASVIEKSGVKFDASDLREVGVEVELAFIMGRDLPARAQPYDRAEVAEAISAFTTLVEIIATRFADSAKLTAIENLADGIRNAAFVLGEPIPQWSSIDLTRGGIELVIDGVVRQSIDPNPSRDPLALVTWLANHLAERCGGLRAGQVVTTGALGGATSIEAPSRAEARYGDLGKILVDIV